MKKSLIALAVAGVVSAPAFAATSNVDVYGVMNIAVQDTDVSGATPAVVDNVSRIGFKGSEDLGGGMKAVWQIESSLSNAVAGAEGVGQNAAKDGTLASRNTFVGLAGGFGTFVMGRHDTPYKLGTGSLDIFGDTIADYNSGRVDGVELIVGGHDARSPSAIAYISPTFSGFHAAVAVVANDNVGASDETLDAVSLTGVYSNGPIFASLSYQDVGDIAGANGNNDALKLGAGYTMGDTSIGFVYEDVDTGAAATDRDSWLVNVKHAMGPIVLKAQYGQVDAGAADQDMWALGADYALSKRTAAYVVFANGDNDNNTAASNGGDVSGWNIGVKHSF